MKRLLPVLPVLVLILSGYQTTSHAYETYRGLPCYFHGAEVKTKNFAATLGELSSPCCPVSRCKGYKTKRGQSINVQRGTPVYAVADMTLVKAENRSASQRCKGSVHSQRLYKRGCKKPYDDLELMFKDELGNLILFYHLISENPFVPGFNKGNCQIPDKFQTEKWKRKPRNCGGIYKTKVNKGDLIGWSGTTGGGSGNHFSFAIKVVNHPDFPGKQGWIVPSNSLTWESRPTKNNMIYLLPLKKPSVSEKDRMEKVNISVDKKNRLIFCSTLSDLNSTFKVYETRHRCKEGHKRVRYRKYLKLKNFKEN